MLYYKNHKLVIEKPIDIIRNDLKSNTENLKVIQLDETKLRGLMDLPYSRKSVQSDIILKPETNNKVFIEIKNTYDYRTYFGIILVFIFCWGVSIFGLSNGNGWLSFHVTPTIILPFFGILIEKFFFNSHDKKIMGIYKSLLNNQEPN